MLELASAQSPSLEVRDDTLGCVGGDPSVNISSWRERNLAIRQMHLDRDSSDDDYIVADLGQHLGCF